MKTLTFRVVALLATLCLFSSAHAGMIESFDARFGLGTSDTSNGSQTFPGFFNGFAGGSSYTNTVSYDDGVVNVDFNITVEGFDFNGNPADLFVIPSSTGIVVGVDNMRLDGGERLKVTYNSINFSNIGPAPAGFLVDPSSFQAMLDTVRLSAYTVGVDQYSYAGVGSVQNAVVNSAGSIDLEIDTPVSGGDMFSVTAVGGAFRALFVSQQAFYELVPVPEPATLGLLAISLVGIAASRRKR